MSRYDICYKRSSTSLVLAAPPRRAAPSPVSNSRDIRAPASGRNLLPATPSWVLRQDFRLRQSASALPMSKNLPAITVARVQPWACLAPRFSAASSPLILSSRASANRALRGEHESRDLRIFSIAATAPRSSTLEGFRWGTVLPVQRFSPASVQLLTLLLGGAAL